MLIFMKPNTFLLCFAAATLGATAISAQQQQPKFQSLTPGANQGSAGWVNHLNAMNEAERQRRVLTFGMPAAPPNRWVKQRQPVPPMPAPRQVSQRSQQQAPPRTQQPPQAPIKRQRSGFPPSLYQSSQAPPVAAAPEPTQPQVIRASVKAAPAPKLKERQLRVAAVRPNQPTAPVATKAKPNPVAKAYPVAWTPNKPVKEAAAAQRQASIRSEIASMPSTNAGRASNPWAPYQSRREYETAVNRSKWQPRGPAARAPQQQRPAPKRLSWIKSLFTRSAPAPRKQQQPRRAAEPKWEKTQTAPKVPSSTYVTRGLPQDNQSGTVIETTLFGR
ncbi:MAG: hypothetical protein ACI8T1_000328 [Verrucomicrobiales bacterium]|jgi:hypothetical protein